MAGKGKQPAPWVAPAGSAKRVRTTRRAAANNTSQGGADKGARSNTTSRDASSHRSPRAPAARGHEMTPAIRREDAGGGADSEFGELQQLLPTQLVLNQVSIGSSLDISDHDMEDAVASGPRAVTASESAAVSASSRPPFSLSQALCAMGQCDILTLVFQNLDIIDDNISIGKAKLVCKAWNATMTRGIMPKILSSGIAELKQLRRLEDMLVLAAPVSSLSPSDAAAVSQQNLLFNSHRRILVDWLVDVQGEYSLSNQTLHTAIQLVDRCLMENPAIGTTFIQLLGVTCLFIASKFCEVTHPLVRDMVWVCDNSYTLNQHLDMEIKVMILLNFKFYTVTPSSYIHVIVQVLGLDDIIATAALYMTSLSMMESDSVGVKPSLTAAAAVSVALSNSYRPVPMGLISKISRQEESLIRKMACRLQLLLHDDYCHAEQAHRAVPRVFDPSHPPLRAIHDRYGAPANAFLSKKIPRAPTMVQCQRSDCCSKARRKRITCSWCGTEECSASARQIYHCEIVECGGGDGIDMQD